MGWPGRPPQSDCNGLRLRGKHMQRPWGWSKLTTCERQSSTEGEEERRREMLEGGWRSAARSSREGPRAGGGRGTYSGERARALAFVGEGGGRRRASSHGEAGRSPLSHSWVPGPASDPAAKTTGTSHLCVFSARYPSAPAPAPLATPRGPSPGHSPLLSGGLLRVECQGGAQAAGRSQGELVRPRVLPAHCLRLKVP